MRLEIGERGLHLERSLLLGRDHKRSARQSSRGSFDSYLFISLRSHEVEVRLARGGLFYLKGDIRYWNLPKKRIT